MGLQDTVSWYQKKIGTYDKQQWEKTIEQRILHGLTHVPMKTTKLKTDFIDVDLVRGSSFPKAKPKHGLVTVTRLGTLRFLFLPLFSRWWVKQTSPRVFALLLILYLLQFLNTGVYVYNSSALPDNSSEHVPISEIIVPIAMMLILSIIHSQIVATNSGSEKQSAYAKNRKVKQRRRKVRHRPDSCDSKTSQEFDGEFPVKDEPSFITKRVKIVTTNGNNNAKVGKRSVVWDSPLKRNLQVKTGEFVSSVDTSENEMYVSASEFRDDIVPENGAAVVNVSVPLDDDGFESLNGNGSSENSVEHLVVKANRVEPAADIQNNTSAANGNELCEAWVKDIVGHPNNFLRRRQSTPEYRRDSIEHETDLSDEPQMLRLRSAMYKRRESLQERKSLQCLEFRTERTNLDGESSGCDSEEGECETLSSPGTGGSCCPLLTEATISATEWMGVTTNSEDCTYSSEYDESDSQAEFNSTIDQAAIWDYDLSPTVILSPSCGPSDKVSCTIWHRRDIKKADLTVLDISSSIIERVEAMHETLDYFYAGILVSVLLASIPAISRLADNIVNSSSNADTQLSIAEFSGLLYQEVTTSFFVIGKLSFGTTIWERVVMLVAFVERCVLGSLFFFLLAVAERTFKQRFLYAKLFSHLTSSRRARKSNLPHFRLNKVRNIKTWLSVRSYLKKRGPQRSVDMIVSAAFIITLLLLSFICVELLKDSVTLHTQYNMEVVFWSVAIGFYLLRFMTLGTKINRKYRNLSVLITEQINLYLQIEQKPHKKDELMVANSVLKLAADLLKELESPFKISGLSANPYLYTITKVVILSALSGVLSETLGFKLKLLKIKIK